MLGFTRVVVSVYVCCAVSALLRVQLSVLGGGLSLQHRDHVGHVMCHVTTCDASLPPQGGSGDSATVQRQYLATVQYLLGEGMFTCPS